MANTFASGKHALGECDRCGFTYKLKQLQALTINEKVTNLLVCSDCWEEDHPQLRAGKYPVTDPQGLRNPRSDAASHADSRELIE